MITLHLLRHAKSSWDEPGLADTERPLNTRGKRACKLMAQVFLQQDGALQNIYCSPARRARQTLERISAQLPEALQWQIDNSLYTFDVEDLLEWLQSQVTDAAHVTLVGHNPALTDLCNYLGDTPVANLPTCAYARIEFDIASWHKVSVRQGKLARLIRPKDFD
ncbi:MAG: histidine phosphatase family protein [Pseudomonadales bacterium]